MPLLRRVLRRPPRARKEALVRRARRPLPRESLSQLRRLPVRLPVRAAARVPAQLSARARAGAQGDLQEVRVAASLRGGFREERRRGKPRHGCEPRARVALHGAHRGSVASLLRLERRPRLVLRGDSTRGHGHLVRTAIALRGGGARDEPHRVLGGPGRGHGPARAAASARRRDLGRGGASLSRRRPGPPAPFPPRAPPPAPHTPPPPPLSLLTLL